MADLAYREVHAMNSVQARVCMVQDYQEKGNITEVAEKWHTSRQTVRKWVRRYREEGLQGLQDRSPRPRCFPNRTPPEVESKVLKAWEQTHYRRERLAAFLLAQGLCVSPHILRHLRPPQTLRRLPSPAVADRRMNCRRVISII
jgi:transposase-like protein